ncbi:hypothetical protein PO909_009869 [Leuciscus waleckii]
MISILHINDIILSLLPTPLLEHRYDYSDAVSGSHFSSQTSSDSKPVPQRVIVSLPASHRSPIQLLTCSIMLCGSHSRVIGTSHSGTSSAFVPLVGCTDPDV